MKDINKLKEDTIKILKLHNQLEQLKMKHNRNNQRSQRDALAQGNFGDQNKNDETREVKSQFLKLGNFIDNNYLQKQSTGCN